MGVYLNNALRKINASVVLGTGHLIDGYHVVYEKDFEAEWTAQNFRLRNNGMFLVDLKCEYKSKDTDICKVYGGGVSTVGDLEYVGSVVFLQVSAVYRQEFFGDFTHVDLTEIIPLTADSVNSAHCQTEYSGSFNPPSERKREELYALEIKISWVRIFKDEENFYYQWMQGDSDVWSGEKLETDRIYNNLSGGFLVYYPIPEGMTSLLLPYEFDYVQWIKENL